MEAEIKHDIMHPVTVSDAVREAVREVDNFLGYDFNIGPLRDWVVRVRSEMHLLERVSENFQGAG